MLNPISYIKEKVAFFQPELKQDPITKSESEAVLTSFQSLNNQEQTADLAEKQVTKLSILPSVSSAFKNLMGVDYNSDAPNVVDSWILGILSAAGSDQLTELKSHLEYVPYLHADNQLAIFSSAFQVAKQENQVAACDLLLVERTKMGPLNERNSAKFDLSKETNAYHIINVLLVPHPITMLKAQAIALAACLGGYKFSHIVSKPTVYVSDASQIPMTQLHMPNCNVKVFSYLESYIPLVISTALFAACAFKTYQYIVESNHNRMRTFGDFAKRYTNDDIEKAVKFCKKYSSTIYDKQIHQTGMKALELGKIELAQQAAKSMKEKENADELYNEIIAKIQA
jgi:hypothetical protein